MDKNLFAVDPKLTEVEVITPWNGGCKLGNGGTADWIEARFKINISPNSDKSAYSVKVYTQLKASYEMRWSGRGNMTCKVTWTDLNGDTQTKTDKVETTTPLNGVGEQSGWSGPASFSFSTKGAKKLTFNIDVDLLRTACNVSSCGSHNKYVGPHYNSGNTHFQHFIYNGYAVNVESIPLLSAPKITGLKNTNPYDNKQGISASETSVSLSWSKASGSDAISESQMRYTIDGKTSNWFKTSGTLSHKRTGFSAGKTIKFEVRAKNDAGYSNTLTLTVRTRHEPPVVSLALETRKLEQLIFEWTSNKGLKSAEYKIDSGSWTKLTISNNQKTGTFIAKWFNPNTQHTVYFRGVSTDALDHLDSNTASDSGTTLDRAHITAPTTNPTFGLPIAFTFSINSTDIRPLKLQIWTEGNGRSPRFTIDPVAVTNSGNTAKYTFTPTQAQLDEMYKCFTNQNQIPIHYLLTTHGEWKDWDDTQRNYNLILTGIAKTAHIGVNNVPRRAQAFIGVNNVPRRAVCWVGVNNVPRRCI